MAKFSNYYTVCIISFNKTLAGLYSQKLLLQRVCLEKQAIDVKNNVAKSKVQTLDNEHS